MSEPELEMFKNVAPYAIDVGGRMVAPGEIAELPPTRRHVKDAATAGHLAPLNTTPADQDKNDQRSATDDTQPVNTAVDDTVVLPAGDEVASTRNRAPRPRTTSATSEES